MSTQATKGARRPQWTDEEVRTLRATVERVRREGGSVRDAFAEVAKERGVKPSAVQTKWYSLPGNGRTKRRKARRKTAVRSSQPVRSRSTSTQLPDFTAMSNVELARFVRASTSELETRMVALEKNVRKLLG